MQIIDNRFICVIKVNSNLFTFSNFSPFLLREESILAKKYNYEFHRKLETQQFCPTETGRQKKF